jgi:predicted transcriptional regulator
MSTSTTKIPVTIRVPSDTVATIDQIAKALERDRTWVMLRALNRYLKQEGADILKEAEAIASLDRGEGIPFDVVMMNMRNIIAGGTTVKKGDSQK